MNHTFFSTFVHSETWSEAYWILRKMRAFVLSKERHMQEPGFLTVDGSERYIKARKKTRFSNQRERSPCRRHSPLSLLSSPQSFLQQLRRLHQQQLRVLWHHQKTQLRLLRHQLWPECSITNTNKNNEFHHHQPLETYILLLHHLPCKWKPWTKTKEESLFDQKTKEIPEQQPNWEWRKRRRKTQRRSLRPSTPSWWASVVTPRCYWRCLPD